MKLTLKTGEVLLIAVAGSADVYELALRQGSSTAPGESVTLDYLEIRSFPGGQIANAIVTRVGEHTPLPHADFSGTLGEFDARNAAARAAHRGSREDTTAGTRR